MRNLLFLVLMLFAVAANAQDNDSLYINPEVPPQYPGGDFELFRYLENYLTLNATFQDLKYLQATDYFALVKFIINEKGEVQDVAFDFRSDNEERVAEQIDGVIPPNYLVDEILNAFQTMPRWEPGKVNGQPVKTKVYTRVELTSDGNQVIAKPRHIFPESAILAERKMTKNQKILALIAAIGIIGLFYFFVFRN